MKRQKHAQLAMAIDARRNCEARGNDEWLERWTDTIAEIMDSAPSGSGFDNGTQLDEEKSNRSKLVFHTSYHHMNEAGYYDGWTDHTITVVPTLVGTEYKVSGRNRNDIKDYIGDVFASWLSEEEEY